MSGYVIADHHLDAVGGVYRLTVGVPQEVEVPKLDEDGQPVFTTETLVVDGEETEVQGAPVTEIRTVAVPLEDFAFSVEDPKWEGKSEEEIVKEQRRLVRAALRKREKAEPAEDVTARRQPLPGVGDAL
jgi:hypothetical protein